MPNYSYYCNHCEAEQVEARKMDERNEVRSCPICCQGTLQRKLEAPALQSFIGCHKDDYTKTGPRK